MPVFLENTKNRPHFRCDYRVNYPSVQIERPIKNSFAEKSNSSLGYRASWQRVNLLLLKHGIHGSWNNAVIFEFLYLADGYRQQKMVQRICAGLDTNFVATRSSIPSSIVRRASNRRKRAEKSNRKSVSWRVYSMISLSFFFLCVHSQNLWDGG